MSITISKAQVTQDLGRNWYHSTQTVTEAHLSPVQYAELISNPNTEGVPCTLYKTQEHGYIEYKPIDSVTQHVESVIDEKVADLKKRASSFAKDIMNIAGQKGGLKKNDKDQIIELARKLQQDLCSNMSFYEKSLKESIEKTKLEAKTEIQAYMAHAINTAGLKALENPETLKLVFKDDLSSDSDN